MPPRTPNNITMMIAQALEKMREIKELQFFGGDSLNLQRFTTTVTIPAGANQKCWRVLMTPGDPKFTMPIDAVFKRANATTYGNGQIERVHRTDGQYEYLLITSGNFDVVPQQMKFVLDYTGVAEFTVTNIA